MTEEQSKYVTQSDVDDALEMIGKGYDDQQPAAIIESPRMVKALSDKGLVEYQAWGWVKTSAKFIGHIKKLKGAKLAIWQTVALSIDVTGTCPLSVNEIADLSGYSRSETIESLKELDEMGYLSTQKQVGRKSIYKPFFVARGASDPEEPTKNNPSRKTTRPVSSLGYPSSPSERNARPSIKELKSIKEEEEEKLSRIVRAYESEIGIITAFIADELKAESACTLEAWIVDAIHEAAVQNKRNWKYVKAILKRWHEQGNQEPAKKQQYERKTTKPAQENLPKGAYAAAAWLAKQDASNGD